MNAPEHTKIARAAIEGAVMIPNTLFKASPTQPRSIFDPVYLKGMADSIKEFGVIQPILARPIAGAKPGEPQYEIVDGECRWRSNQLAGAPEIPTLVKMLTDLEVMKIQLVTFLQRKDLNALEEARGYQNMLRKPDGTHGFATVEDMAKSIDRSRRHVFNRLKLLELTEPAKAKLIEGTLQPSIAILVARLQPADQAEALKLAIDGWGGRPLTQREASDQFERRFMLRLDKAPFKVTDAKLVPAAGSCRDCPKRTGANPDLFDDIKSADTCTDSKCYQLKVSTHHEAVLEAGKAQGLEVITGAQAKKVMPSEHGELKGYLKLDEQDYRIGDKPLAKLLGKEAPATVLLENPHTHEVVKVVREDEAIAVLKSKGVLKTSKVPNSSANTRSQEAKAKAATAWRTAAIEQCMQAVLQPEIDAAKFAVFIWPEIALTMWKRLSGDDEKRCEKLLGWVHVPGFEARGQKLIDDRIRALPMPELGRLITTMCLVGEAHVNQFVRDVNDAPKIARFADQLGVDVAKIRRDFAAGTKAKPAAKSASTPPISAAAQGAKSGPVTPERALAKAVAKEAAAAATKKKADQKDNTAKLSASKATPTKPTAQAKGAEVKDKAAAPPPPAGDSKLKVGQQARVKLDAAGRKKTQGRVGTVDAIGGNSVTLRWGSRSHEIGVYPLTQVEAVPVAAAQLSEVAAWPFPRGGTVGGVA